MLSAAQSYSFIDTLPLNPLARKLPGPGLARHTDALSAKAFGSRWLVCLQQSERGGEGIEGESAPWPKSFALTKPLSTKTLLFSCVRARAFRAFRCLIQLLDLAVLG